MNNASSIEIEELFVPYGIGQQYEMQSAGNTNCWRDQQINNFQDFLNSDCVWIQFWVELRGSEKAAAFRSSSTTTCASRRRSAASNGH
jgi:putative ABC transport system permease protein